MTYEDFCKLPFRMASHLNLGDEHASTYVCTVPEYENRILVCVHVPYRDGEPKGRCIRHWMIDGKVYKSKKKLIEAITEL